VLSQTTQIPARFTEFVKGLVGSALAKDTELRVVDTICHDIRQRQRAALELAGRVDMMLVVGGHTSANSHRLLDLCSEVTEAYLVETAEEIQPVWLEGKGYIGITAGASTDEQTIDEVLKALKSMA
jgi:4-hydroxy-3-methylbut-2-enyl diphosphate reductase